MSWSKIALFQEFSWKEKKKNTQQKNKRDFMSEVKYNSLSSQDFLFPFYKPAS